MSSIELALKLLSLPREIGKHPETGEPITAGLGRFGPFVKHEKTYASLEAGDEVFDIGINRAVTLIAEKIAKGPSRRFGADPGKAIGDHPTLGTVTVKGGRYGAYVTAGGVNATIPSEFEKDAITLPQAIALIDERAAKGGGKKPKKAAKPAKAKKYSEAARPPMATTPRRRRNRPRRRQPKPKLNPPARRAQPWRRRPRLQQSRRRRPRPPPTKAPAKKSAGTNRG